MINRNQIRVARAYLGWTIEQLSKKAHVAPNTVRRAERSRDADVVRIHPNNLLAIENVLKAAGCEFPDDRSVSSHEGTIKMKTLANVLPHGLYARMVEAMNERGITSELEFIDWLIEKAESNKL